MPKIININIFIYLALLLISLGFLSPITSTFSLMMYKELMAVTGLILLLIINLKQSKIYVDKSIYVLLGICIIPIIQYMVGIIYFKQDAFFACAYLMILASGIFIGINTQEIWIKNLLIALSIIGFLSTAMSINQIFFQYQSIFLLGASYGGRATANMGQPNQLGTLLVISLCSLFYIHLKYHLNKILFFSYIFLVFIAIYLTQSRTAWLSVFLISFLYLIKYHTKRDLLNVSGLNISFILIAALIPKVQSLLTNNNIPQNVIERAQSGSSRFKIWPQLIESAFDKPFFGYGWGQVDIAQMQTANDYSTKGEWFTYSHNLFLDLNVWNGILLGSLLSIIIIYTIFNLYLKIKDKENLFLYFIIIVFFVHCMLEYPFAYAYFPIVIGIIYGYLKKIILLGNNLNANN